MAMKRTGSPRSVGGGAKPIKKFLNSAGLILELLGRPVLWALLAISFLILFLFRLLFKILCLTPRLVTGLSLFVVKLLGSAIFLILKLVGFFLNLFFSLLKTALSRSWSKTKTLLFKVSLQRLAKTISSYFKKIKKRLPRPKRPKIRRPKLRLPKIRIGRKFWLFLAFLLLIGASGAWAYLVILKDLPHPDRLISREQIVSTKIYDRKGRLLYKIYRNQNRTLVKLKDIPPDLIQATVAIEDAEFYQHYGFSLRGISRSLLKNLAEGKLQGGSTITQQLVKNALLTPERTLIRKVKELVLSIQTEMRFNKEEILQMYLNEVGYGGAAYGAEEASWKYFNKSVRDLRLSESALLAGLPASPTVYSPFGARPEMAKRRQIQVLQRMVSEGFITPEEAEKAKATELEFATQETNIDAPHFVMYVKDLLARDFGEQLVEEGGLEVVTSLDLEIQRLAEKIVAEEIGNLKKLNVTNGAAFGVGAAMGCGRCEQRRTQGSHRTTCVHFRLLVRVPASRVHSICGAGMSRGGFQATAVSSLRV